MIAIGGCIGTGLFMTSGGAIHDAGTLGALIAYAVWYNGILPDDISWGNGCLFTSFRFI